MVVTRVTQQMLSSRSLNAVMGGLSQMSGYQEQLQTGRKINRISDDVGASSTALRLRTALAEQNQYARNGRDGQAWLSAIDSTLGGVGLQLQRANVLALQGANDGGMSDASRKALAVEVNQIRASLLAQANTDYLGRPLFGGTTAGKEAFDSTGAYVGDTGAVMRRVGPDVTVRVDSVGTDVFGPDNDNVFGHLKELSEALEDGDTSAISGSIAKLQGDLTRITAQQADEGARLNRIQNAAELVSQAQLRLTSSLSDVEDVDLAEATINVQQAEVAYKAALAATAKTLQPSLLDFLR